MTYHNDTICAIATPSGNGAIAMIRVSGPDAISILSKIFFMPGNKKISEQPGNTLHYGEIRDQNQTIDEVMVSLFKSPRSYTGEEIVEISCHGSVFIQQKILQLLVRSGCRIAKPGEFTQRAFLNGKMDLSQAEAVADVIASNSEASHKLAFQQLKGGISNEISQLREQLLNFASLIELELDFSEEDVEFANREELFKLVNNVERSVVKLIHSFDTGNAIKKGIPVAIVGKPNVGKSTLLNLLLKEDKAIVSEIAGTTRDVIEDIIVIEGYTFRFIDTAGIRNTTDTIENLGIQKSLDNIKKAQIVLLLVDVNDSAGQIMQLAHDLRLNENKQFLILVNKIDINSHIDVQNTIDSLIDHNIPAMGLSAKNSTGIDDLNNKLIELSNVSQLEEMDVVLTNARHLEALQQTFEALQTIKANTEAGLSNDFLAQDIRQAIHFLGEISGVITTDDILGNIFKNFCIGK